MDNLPNSPITPNSDNVVPPFYPVTIQNITQDTQSQADQQQTNQQQPVQPQVPPTFQPTAPSGSEVFPISTKEQKYTETLNTIINESTPETLKSTEKNEIVKNMEDRKIKRDDAAVSQPATAAPKDIAKVIDETEKITSLHTIDEAADPLTKEADEEEEKFIKEVEKHHGHI